MLVKVTPYRQNNPGSCLRKIQVVCEYTYQIWPIIDTVNLSNASRTGSTLVLEQGNEDLITNIVIPKASKKLASETQALKMISVISQIQWTVTLIIVLKGILQNQTDSDRNSLNALQVPQKYLSLNLFQMTSSSSGSTNV